MRTIRNKAIQIRPDVLHIYEFKSRKTGAVFHVFHNVVDDEWSDDNVEADELFLGENSVRDSSGHISETKLSQYADVIMTVSANGSMTVTKNRWGLSGTVNEIEFVQ